jgi:hypothetical protein
VKTNIFVLYLLLSQLCISQNVFTTKFPLTNQLYPRNSVTNIATVPIDGYVLVTSNYNTISLKIYRDNVLLNTLNQNLQYNYLTGIATFNFEANIVAELNNYKFELIADTTLIKAAYTVVAGDVYLFQGQSNMRGEASGISNERTSFIRSFGRPPSDPQIDNWSVNYYAGGIPNYIALQFINEKSIPIAIFNGALGGINISNLQRNDANPTDLTTNYGKLLNRFKLAGLAPGDVKAMIFYQGEANETNSIESYKDLFYQLKSDWTEDYAPPLYYMFQVHKGCGVTTSSFQYEAQRQIAIEVPNLKLISTNGVLQNPDFCHFSYNTGYSVFGQRLYDLINYDIYNIGTTTGIYSPTITNISFTNSQKNEITFELQPNSDNFTLDNGVENDFFFSDSGITVTKISLTGNVAILNLSNSFTASDPKISYLGTNPNASPILKNQNDIGLINFKNLPVNSQSFVELNDGDWTYYYYVSDLSNPVFGLEKTPSGITANNAIFNVIEFDVTDTENVIESTSVGTKKGTFNLAKYWNLKIDNLPNGWVNIRFFYPEVLQINLINSANTFAANNSASFISDLMFIKTKQYFRPINQINNEGFTIEIKKAGVSSSYGSYLGSHYLQLNKLLLDSNYIGGSVIKKVESEVYYTPTPKAGTIRFNTFIEKFQGWNGLQWLNFN